MGGEIVDTAMTKKKKKKGRPSLLDLQKRSIKLEQQQQEQLQQLKNPNSIQQNPKTPFLSPNANPTSNRRSTRRNPNPDEEDDDGDEGADDEDERKEKKLKLLHGLNSRDSENHFLNDYQNSSGVSLYGSDSNAGGGDDNKTGLKRPKINAVRLGSDEMGEKVSKATDTIHGSPVESGPTTPLPDKKLLVFILDRLQKKDSYGVFSEPVDPEELPDYHEIIENPMDFATLRKKLDAGAYTNLELFEKDVYLICSNAMQYNSSDTIYFRQARTIQELAKKDFDNLRQDSDSEPQPRPLPLPRPRPRPQPQPQPQSQSQPKVARRGRPPGKMKKSVERSPFDRVGSEFSSDATLASGVDNNNSNGYNLRKTTPYKYQPADLRTSYGSHSSETLAAWLSEWENEFPASVVRAVLKYGKKPFPVDENRRDTYKNSVDSAHEPSVLNTFDGELKQLMVVGLNSEHGYARSLARFAAGLGPAAWKIASKKIQSVLLPGVEFGPGWVGENDLVGGQRFFDKLGGPNNYPSQNQLDRFQPAMTTGTTSTVMNRDFVWSGDDFREAGRGLNLQSEFISRNSNVGAIKVTPPAPIQQKPMIHPDINGYRGEFGYNSSQMDGARLRTPTGNSSFAQGAMPPQMFGMVPTSSTPISSLPVSDISSSKSIAESGFASHYGNSSALVSSTDRHALPSMGLGSKPSWQSMSSYHQPELLPFPPDLNVGFFSPSSPSSNVPIGSPQQPDLALQL